MKFALKLSCISLLVLLFALPALAQEPENIMTESGEIMGAEEQDTDAPIDGITEKKLGVESRVLPYDHVREADIFWEKRIWRVIDTREKMNLTFRYPERPLFTILMEAAESGEITVYNTIDDKFTTELEPNEVASMGSSTDTVVSFDPETYEEEVKVVTNEINPDDIKRYRIKEIWFFDEETSTLKVRILGIAPLLDVKDDNGNFLYEQPMFWVYYPEAREMLAKEKVFMYGNDAAPMSWEDLFEMRFFSSYIYKESNVFNRRIQDYLSGVDRLLEAERIEKEIFNFEHDLWSY